MEFVSYSEVDGHKGLREAYELHKKNNPKPEGSQAEIETVIGE